MHRERLLPQRISMLPPQDELLAFVETIGRKGDLLTRIRSYDEQRTPNVIFMSF